jgi:hypothetical protein
MTSKRTKSAEAFSTRFRAVSPSLAVMTSYFADVNAFVRRSRFCLLSSTASMREGRLAISLSFFSSKPQFSGTNFRII